MINDFPKGLDDPRDVRIFNAELKSIWHQERALLNNPLAKFSEYEFVDGPTAGVDVVRNTVIEYEDVAVSVPNLDDEQVVNSGGLILPTDRFLSAYDINPAILSVVEWPQGSGNLFTIRRKEYNPASGRLELLIRQGNHLSGVIYKRVSKVEFSGANWNHIYTMDGIVLTVNKSDLFTEEQLLFASYAVESDIVFWALKSGFRTDRNNPSTEFKPSVGDFIVDTDTLGNTVGYRVVSTLLDSRLDFWRLLCRRYTEGSVELPIEVPPEPEP